MSFRLLCTSDWQCDYSNIDLCERAQEELLAWAAEYKPEAIINLGDFKERYDPIAGAVIKFWVRAIGQVRKAGFRYIALQGNHDRLSQGRDAQHWMDVLCAAGAETVSRPKVISVGDGSVAFLPFTPDKKQEIEWAAQLAEVVSASGFGRALCFHTGVGDVVSHQQGMTLEELGVSHYTAAFGGHVHEHQRLGDTDAWYVGSPFAQDWNEINQSKGMMLADIDESGVEVKFLRSAIPGWYDSCFLEEHNITPEPGAYIRSRVNVSTKKVTQGLRKETVRLEKAYPGCRLFVVPQLVSPEKLDVELSGVTDLEKVAQYVAATPNEAAKYRAEQLVAYIASKLGKIDPGASLRQIDLSYVAAKNVLLFPEIKVRYKNQGFVLLRGKNRDWPKRSNGAGKSCLLALLSVGLFGETLKKQRNDAWAMERVDDPAEIKLVLRDGRGRKVEIVRGRRPHKLELYVDGRDVCSGLTGKEKLGGTQSKIEEITGFDKRTLVNSIYIDQTIANGFVFGTQKDRMDLVNKLCDLDRFDRAGKLVSIDIRAAGKDKTEWKMRLEGLIEKRIALDGQPTPVIEHYWLDKWKLATKNSRILREARVSLMSSQKSVEAWEAERDNLASDLQELQRRCLGISTKAATLTEAIARAKKLIKSGKCPTCSQPSEQVGAVQLKLAEAALASIDVQGARESVDACQGKVRRLDQKIGIYDRELEKSEEALQSALDIEAQADEAMRQEKERNAEIEQAIAADKKQMALTVRGLEACNDHLKDLDKLMSLFDAAQKALHRSGMPLYMAASLCPLLNRAAEEYSEMFFQGAIKVNFAVVDGEFVPTIVNPTGSDSSDGQSTGEAAMAGVVAAFALREAAPKTNLLILDEPGHGLDGEGCRQFAYGLLKLRGKIPTILVTTHSAVIESILSGETVWTVTKQNGCGTLETAT